MSIVLPAPLMRHFAAQSRSGAGTRACRRAAKASPVGVAVFYRNGPASGHAH